MLGKLLASITVIGLMFSSQQPVVTAPAAAPPADAPGTYRVGSDCAGTLQSLIDAAPSGGLVIAAPCVYRETVTIDKPLTLIGQPGSAIVGSDVWTGWTPSGSTWRSLLSAPAITGQWPCANDSHDGCRHLAQVFMDGVPLGHVDGTPQHSQFALDSTAHIVLADDPRGRTVEVTTRQQWVYGEASNVTIMGFTMADAVSAAQHGAIANNGYANWTVAYNSLSDATGAAASLDQASNLQLLGNVITRSGQEALHSDHGTNLVIEGNIISQSNTLHFEPSWEAGGMKLGTATNAVMSNNDVSGSDGVGIWCDLGCSNVTIANNRVHDNTWEGIDYEISGTGTITHNVVWNNGQDRTDWGFGAGITCQNCNRTLIDSNIVAWCDKGIAVINQQRPDGAPATLDSIANNIVLVASAGQVAFGWWDDTGGNLYASAAGNTGRNNLIWYATPEDGANRYVWSRNFTSIRAFSETAGGESSYYLTNQAASELIDSLDLPNIDFPLFGLDSFTAGVYG